MKDVIEIYGFGVACLAYDILYKSRSKTELGAYAFIATWPICFGLAFVVGASIEFFHLLKRLRRAI